MSSILCHCSIFLFFLATLVFPTIFGAGNTCSLTVGNVCAKTDDLVLCLKGLKLPDTTPADFPTLCPISVNLIQESVTSTITELNTLIKDEKNVDLKTNYTVCLEHYESGSKSLTKCGDLAKAGKIREVGYCVSEVLNETEECYWNDHPSAHPELDETIREVNTFGSLALAVSAYGSIC